MKKKLIIVGLFFLALLLSGCNEQKTDDTKENLPPGSEKEENDFNLPAIDLSKPIPENPVNSQTKNTALGDIEITYNDVVYSNQIYSFGADIYFTLKNNADSIKTVYLEQDTDIASSNSIPSWNMHFFGFQADSVSINPGAEETVHFFASMDSDGEFDVNFEFWTESDKSDKVTTPVTFYCDSEKLSFPDSAFIYGTVYDKTTNKPINGAEVACSFYNGREIAGHEKTKEGGTYVLSIPSTDDLTVFFGNQKLGYASLNHFIYVEANGYEYYYEEVDVPRGDKKELTIYLEPIDKLQYEISWDTAVSDYFGFFWLNIDNTWDNILAVQAKHPPELNQATHVYFYDAQTGTEKWSFDVGDECWGSDISSDGSLIALGSHDRYVYVVNTADGSLKWKQDCGNMNREVEFSTDDTFLLTGPVQDSGSNYDFGLYNVEDSSIEHSFSGFDRWLRNSRFNSDGSKFVVGLSGGYLCMYETQTGELLWDNYIGEFPLFLEVDSEDNVYATGKGRTLFSFDSEGKLRWSYRLPDHTITSGVVSKDGKYLAVGSVGAWVYYIDTSNGEIVWRAPLSNAGIEVNEEISSVGHNAVSISSDGGYIAVGGGPANHLTVFDSASGTKLFEHTAELNDDPLLESKFSTIGGTSSDSSQKGIMCTVISENGGKIIAAYGDNYIRCFTKN